MIHCVFLCGNCINPLEIIFHNCYDVAVEWGVGRSWSYGRVEVYKGVVTFLNNVSLKFKIGHFVREGDIIYTGCFRRNSWLMERILLPQFSSLYRHQGYHYATRPDQNSYIFTMLLPLFFNAIILYYLHNKKLPPLFFWYIKLKRPSR